jgi:GntR family transcriptional repressor for pyruvate dehydrogenase complex
MAEDQVQFDQIRREPRLSDKVADAMLQTILSRGLRSGDRLPSERELGEQFGVSRTVVREAVRVLSAKGIVETRTGSGVRVAAVDAGAVSEAMSLFLHGHQTLDYRKVHEIRTMVEVQMAGVAAERASIAGLSRLEAACERVENEIAHVERAAFADVAFHRAIGACTQNELYVVLLDSIAPSLVGIRRDALGAGAGAAALEQHRQILERIEKRDRPGARAAMQVHLDAIEAVWESRHRG